MTREYRIKTAHGAKPEKRKKISGNKIKKF